MKKYFTICFMLIYMICLAGCGKSADPKTPGISGTAGTPEAPGTSEASETSETAAISGTAGASANTDTAESTESAGNTSATPTSAAQIPSFKPLKSLSAPADITEGRTPAPIEEPLPTDVIGLFGWIQEDGKQTALLAKTENVSLYALPDEGVLLQWGKTSAEFDWSFCGPRIIEPQLCVCDIDYDGDTEVIFINYTEGGTGVSISELHVIEKTENTLTDYRFPDTLWKDILTETLGFWVNGDRFFVTMGDELVDISDDFRNWNIRPEDIRGFNTGYICEFSLIYYDQNSSDNSVLFDGSAMLDAEGIPPTVAYEARITAYVRYRDGVFTLNGLHLDSYDNGNL